MHRTIPKKFGVGDSIMLSAHDLTKPWYATRVTPERIEFNQAFRAPRGSLLMTPEALRFAREHNVTPDTVLIEPNIKGAFSSTNKAWPWERWQAVVLELKRDVLFLQACQQSKPVLQGVRLIPTRSVWDAIALLYASAGVVTTEGALHHAAGALYKPAVVVWTAYSDPAILGYSDHVNLYHADPRGLGQRRPCEYCKASAEKISVDDVVQAIKETFVARINTKPGLVDTGTPEQSALSG